MKLKLADEAALSDDRYVPDGALLVEYDNGETKPLNPVKLIGDVKKVSDRAAALEKERDGLKTQYDSITTLFNGSDPEEFLTKAKAAMETVEGLEAGDLADAETLRRAKEDVARGYEDKIKRSKEQYEAQIRKLQEDLKTSNERRLERLKESAFASSKFVSKLTAPPDLIQSKFGAYFFEDESGNLRARDANGDTIKSPTDPVSDASFEEAIMILVDKYPHKDSLFPGRGGSGSGTPPHSSSSSPTGKTVTREKLLVATPERRQQMMREGYEVVD